MVAMCLGDWFPRKVLLDDPSIDRLPDVLRAFIRFAGEQRGLAADLVAETLEAVDRFEPDFRTAMRDPTMAGPAKGLVGAMLAAGVDISDKRAMDAWMLAFNVMPQETRDRILGGGPIL